MNRRQWLAVFVALVAITGGLTRALTNRKALNRRLYDTLATSGFRDDRYKIALQAYAELRRSIDERPICLEPPIRDDCINILVLDAVSDGSQGAGSSTPWLRDLRLNALALRPNLILVDARLLDFLSVALNNALTATTAHLLKEGFYADVMRNAMAQASYADFADIEEFFKPGSVADGSPIWKLAEQSLETYQRMSNEKGPLGSLKNSYFVVVFAILLEHEIAHLDGGGTPHWAFRIKSVVEQAAASMVYREELRADRIALDRVTRMMEMFRIWSRSNPSELDEYFEDPFFGNLPLIAYAGFLRDLALYDGLQGFRGLAARDLALSFLHRNCEEEPGLELLGFNAQDRILAAGRKSLPILTEEEFSILRSRLANADLSQTHRHNFVRAEEVLARIKLLPQFIDVENPRQSDYINALLQNKPSLAFIDKSPFIPIPGTDMNHIVDKAKLWMKLEPAVMCPLERCYVGHFPNGDGFVEVIGTATQLSDLRFVYNMRPAWDVPDGDEVAKTRAMDAYLESMSRMLAFFGLLANGKEATVRAQIIAGYLRLPIFKCGLGSQQVENAGIFYRSHSLSKLGWIEITARAASRKDFP